MHTDTHNHPSRRRRTGDSDSNTDRFDPVFWCKIKISLIFWKKNKEFLYPEYDDKKHVTRIELELRPKKASLIKQSWILNLEYLFWVFYNEVYTYNLQYFKFIKFWDIKKVEKLWSKIYREKKNRIIQRQETYIKYWNDFFNDKEKNQVLWCYMSYAKKLYKNWYKIEDLKTILDNLLI